MRRVLLDHCVPRRVRASLVDCETVTAFQRGWAELKNGALLKTAEDCGFDVLITADKNLRYQQQLSGRRIGYSAIAHEFSSGFAAALCCDC